MLRRKRLFRGGFLFETSETSNCLVQPKSVVKTKKRVIFYVVPWYITL